nr:unnamed protein product [Callosobruchus analis]
MSKSPSKGATAVSSKLNAKLSNVKKEVKNQKAESKVSVKVEKPATQNVVPKKVQPRNGAKSFPEEKNESIITLTKVAQDMSNILEDLKVNLSNFKKKDNFKDVEPELEKLITKKPSQALSSTANINQKILQHKAQNAVKNMHGSPSGSSNQKQQVTRQRSSVQKTDTKTNAPAGTQRRSRSAKSGTKRTTTPKSADSRSKTASPTCRGSSKVDRSTPVSGVTSTNIASKECCKPVVNMSVVPTHSDRPLLVRTSSVSDQRSSFRFLSGLRDMIPIPNSLLRPGRPSSAPRTIDRDTYDPLGSIRDEVKAAIKDCKTFTIKGCYPGIRKALLKRGWVEKIHVAYRDRLSDELRKFQNYSIQELVGLLRNKDISEICRRLIKSKLLMNHQVDLYWSTNYEPFRECSDKVKLTLINRIRRQDCAYTSKQGLCEASKRCFWCQIPGVAQLNHPRSYALVKNGDTEDFIKDFNITAAMSMLKWVKINSESGQCKIMSPAGKIPIKIFDFAVTECYKFIKRSKHEDIDVEIEDSLSHDWSEFLEYFYKLVHVGNHFKEVPYVKENNMVRKASYILENLKSCWPYLDMDGIMNIWILKPTNSSQGVGIHMCRTLNYVLDIIKKNPNRRYIIQKYIERPLLIHNTKFDIRQWFLISSPVPLTIWFYKQCYVRFSSQTFNLRKLHESIHLTNNSVQCRYNKNTSRDITLPWYNMWDCNQFKNYLSDIGFPHAFDKIIYPGMKQSIIAAILLNEEKIEPRRNSFELYGADFMITEDFKPWLLEINSSPALYASTPVTAKMCPVVLEDVIKVIVDHGRNSRASTGLFELAYKGKVTTNLPRTARFEVSTIPLTNSYFHTPSAISKMSPKCSLRRNLSLMNQMSREHPELYLNQISMAMKQMMEKMLQVLNEKKKRQKNRQNKGVETVCVKEAIDTQTSCTTREIVLKEVHLDLCPEKESLVGQN